MKFIACLALLVALLVAVSVDAATLNVSPSGTDSGNCQAAACASLDYAVGQSASGDTISLSAGTFTGALNRNILVSGTTLNFIGQGPESTILDLQSGGRGFAIVANAKVLIRGMAIINGRAPAPPSYQATTAGGAIIAENCEMTLDNVVMRDNLAPGEIFNAPGGALLVYNANSTINNCVFDHNQGGIAGAVYFGGTSITYINFSKITRNFNIGGWGGAMVPEENSVTYIDNCLFEENSGDYGGAIDDGSFAVWTCTNSIFRRNTALYGGAYYGYGDATATFRNVSFIDNKVTSAGGASQTTTRTKTYFEDCLFEGNEASDTAAIGSSNYNTTFNRCTFRGNKTPTVASAINARFNVTILNCLFESNYAGERGTVAVAAEPITMDNCVFINNFAGIQGGAILFEDQIAFDQHFTKLTFKGNTAKVRGGSVFVTGSGNIVLSDVTVEGGNAAQGGFLSALGSVSVTVEDASFTGLTATRGAAFHLAETGSISVVRSTISGGHAIISGGIAYVDDAGSLSIADSDIHHNAARYGGLVAYAVSATSPCSVLFQNTPIHNNTAELAGAIFWSDNEIPACNSTLVASPITDAIVGAYGPIFAGPPVTVQFITLPPSSVSPSQPFSAVFSLLDYYNQTVKNNRNFVGEVAIVSGPAEARLGGVVSEDITNNGTVTFNLVRINSMPGTNVTLEFRTSPPVLHTQMLNIVVSNCGEGFESYISPAGAYYCLRTNDTSSGIQIALAIITAILLFGGIVLFAVVIKNGDSPIIRAASPVFLNSIVIGGILTLIASFMFLWNTDATCALRPWFYCIGFMILYGSLFVKEFRMFRIFNADLTKPVRITNRQLLVVVGLGVLAEIVLLIAWFAWSPYVRVPRVDDLDLTPIPGITYECSSRNGSAVFWVLVGFNLLLLVICSTIAFLTRNLPDTLNESKGMAFSIYNMTLTLCVALAIGGALYSPSAVSLVGSISILFSTSVTLGALFLPKLWLALRKEAVIRSIQADIAQLKTDIVWKERQIQEIERGFRPESLNNSSSSRATSVTMGDSRVDSRVVSAALSGDADDDNSYKPVKTTPTPTSAKKSSSSGRAARKPAAAAADSDEEEMTAPKKRAKKQPAAAAEEAADEPEAEAAEKPKKRRAKKAAPPPESSSSSPDSD